MRNLRVRQDGWFSDVFGWRRDFEFTRHNFMSNRKTGIILLVLALIGAGIATAPYLSAVFETRKDAETSVAVKLAGLKTGSFVEVKLPASRVFVLRDFDEQVHVFTVPFSDSAYWLPEFDWSRPAVPCAEFGPDNKDGILIEDGAFRCRRPDQGEFFRYEHAWAYSGRNLGYRTADMRIADYEITADSVLLSQRR